MVVRVGGSFAYLPGDGMLTFEDHVRTVADLKAAIQAKTDIPAIKQVLCSFREVAIDDTLTQASVIGVFVLGGERFLDLKQVLI